MYRFVEFEFVGFNLRYLRRLVEEEIKAHVALSDTPDSVSSGWHFDYPVRPSTRLVFLVGLVVKLLLQGVTLISCGLHVDGPARCFMKGHLQLMDVSPIWDMPGTLLPGGVPNTLPEGRRSSFVKKPFEAEVAIKVAQDRLHRLTRLRGLLSRLRGLFSWLRGLLSLRKGHDQPGDLSNTVRSHKQPLRGYNGAREPLNEDELPSCVGTDHAKEELTILELLPQIGELEAAWMSLPSTLTPTRFKNLVVKNCSGALTLTCQGTSTSTSWATSSWVARMNPPCLRLVAMPEITSWSTVQRKSETKKERVARKRVKRGESLSEAPVLIRPQESDSTRTICPAVIKGKDKGIAIKESEESSLDDDVLPLPPPYAPLANQPMVENLEGHPPPTRKSSGRETFGHAYARLKGTCVVIKKKVEVLEAQLGELEKDFEESEKWVRELTARGEELEASKSRKENTSIHDVASSEQPTDATS
uniref:Uncharacterized protein n=1 Tax=Cannabis sativa TaxID=3483 RepID=A0A803PUM8_CANSA